MAKLTDPGEMDIIRSIYFASTDPRPSPFDIHDEEISRELMDRWKHTQSFQSSR